MKTFKEMIKVDIKVGDTVLGGKFKNKKIVVKSIGKNAKGDLTINGRPLMRYRIIKEFKKVSEGPLVISKYDGVHILAQDLENLMHKDDRIIKIVAKILKKKVHVDKRKMVYHQ